MTNTGTTDSVETLTDLTWCCGRVAVFQRLNITRWRRGSRRAARTWRTASWRRSTSRVWPNASSTAPRAVPTAPRSTPRWPLVPALATRSTAGGNASWTRWSATVRRWRWRTAGSTMTWTSPDVTERHVVGLLLVQYQIIYVLSRISDNNSIIATLIARRFTSANEVMFSPLSVCLSVF